MPARPPTAPRCTSTSHQGALDGAPARTAWTRRSTRTRTTSSTRAPTSPASDYDVTQEQITYLGDELANQILAVNEEHFGDLGAPEGADASDPGQLRPRDLVYNVQDEMYYDCAETSYTAGYFAPEYLSADSLAMNVMVIDAFDWANRVGEDPSAADWTDGDPANDRPELYEGVIAHELEHMLMNYSDPGELSWVDEGLADMAAFLNGYDMTGSHLTYQQVFHRETSLTRWGGGLENYGASFSYFAVPVGAGRWQRRRHARARPRVRRHRGRPADPQLIFKEQADGMVGVQNAIDLLTAGWRPRLGRGPLQGLGRRHVPRRRGLRRCGTWPTSTSARPRAVGRSTSPTASSGATAATTTAPFPTRSGTG